MDTENTLREYTETRMKMYLDMIKTKCKKEDEAKLYDNIMELISCIILLCRIKCNRCTNVRQDKDKTQNNK